MASPQRAIRPRCPPARPLFARLLTIGAAAALSHRAASQCADDDPGLVSGFLQVGINEPRATCIALASQGMCGVMVDAGLVGYCGMSCPGHCTFSTAQCTAAAETADTMKDILNFLGVCPYDGMCAGAADAALRLPVCASAAGAAPSTDGCVTLPAECPLACAEVILPVAAQCAGDAGLFAAALPTGLMEACDAAVEVVLAGAPASITVTVEGGPTAGTACHTVESEDRGFEGRYLLQPVTLNGRPHYAQPGSGGLICGAADFRNRQCGRHLYWSRGKANQRTAMWLLDGITDSSAPSNDAHFYLVSPGDVLPLGPAKWIENWLNHGTLAIPTDGETVDRSDLEANGYSIGRDTCRLELMQSPPVGGCDAGLAALTPVLSALCCGPEASPGCGIAGQLPDTCSAECKGMWAPFAARCPALVDTMAATSAGEFFNVACSSRVLEPLPPTGGNTVLLVANTTVSASDLGVDTLTTCESIGGCMVSYPFVAVAGTRYVFQVRLSLGILGTFSFHLATGPMFAAVRNSEGQWVRTAATDATVVATDGQFAAPDKGFVWTAPASGTYYIEAEFPLGRNPTVSGVRDSSFSVEAVGTAVGRAIRADTAGAAATLGVSCEMFTCGFTHNGAPVLDASSAGYELLLQARQGVAYAMAVVLVGTVAAEIHLKAYYPGSAAGAGGFDEVLGGPLGDWIQTPPGHWAFQGLESHEEFVRRAAAGGSGATPLFGFHPGGSFERGKRATWAAPAAGAALLRVVASCDVRYLADTAAPGCHNRGGLIGCDSTFDGSSYNGPSNAMCSAEMTLTITAGAYFDEMAAESSSQLAEMYVPTPGAAVRVATIEMGRPELEQLAGEIFVPTATLAVLPTLEQMLVPGSEASELLASMFSAEQQPHLSFPTAVTPLAGGTSPLPTENGGHRRQLQRADGSIDRVLITVKATAPTVEESELTIAGLQQALATNGRRLQQTVTSNITTRRWLQNAEVCISGIDLSEECQRAAQCAVGMAAACIIDSDCESTAPITAAVTVETIEVSRSESEQRAAEMFAVSPPVGMMEPPTLEQMLVPGSEASVMLATMFTTEQLPHLAFPTAIEGIDAPPDDTGRRLQDGHAAGVRVTIRASAPTVEEVDNVLQRIRTGNAQHRRPHLDESNGGHRMLTIF